MKPFVKYAILTCAVACAGLVMADEAAEALKSRNLNALSDLMKTDAVTAPEPVTTPEPPAPEPVVKTEPTPEPIVTPEPKPSATAVSIAVDPVEADPVPTTVAPDLSDLQKQLNAQAQTVRRVSTPAVPAATPAPTPTPKKGFFGRLFSGSSDSATQVEPTPVAPAPGPLGDLAGSLPTRPSVDAANIRRSRTELEDLIAKSREEVTRQTTTGQTEVIGGESIPAGFDLDPDAWKQAGPNAWKYQGEWKDGTFAGQGHLQYADGWEYRGAFKQGKMEGMGVLNLPDGTQFEGLWRNGQMHGVGKLTYPDGWVYIGQWIDGKISGRGTLIHPGD